MSTISNNILTTEQTNQIFENMSDGVLLTDENAIITYVNSSGAKLLQMHPDEMIGKDFRTLFLQNKKNLGFNKLFHASMDQGQITEKKLVKYRINDEIYRFCIDISLIQSSEKLRRKEPFQGMLVRMEDQTTAYRLKQHSHDCAYIFAGLIFCISVYLAIWSLCRFTLHLPLKKSQYTGMIEFITFLLFLEIEFCTSFSLKEIGLIPNLRRIKINIRETSLTALIAILVLLLTKIVFLVAGFPVKSYFIGGSLHGAYTYIFTAFIQEFLARGVIQTSVKSLMQVKFQSFFCIFLTSLLFALMHLPFGFYFMAGAFFLSLALGFIYERQKDIWGCSILHWSCGYLAMCLFF